MPGPVYRFKSGWREDLQIKVRSGWEAKVLRWLTSQQETWEYEPKRFEFPIKRGTRSYTPDIYLKDKDIWIEIKGALSSTDKTRIRRFKKYYPDEFAKLVGIPGTPTTEAAVWFSTMGIPIMAHVLELDKEFRDVIPNWND